MPPTGYMRRRSCPEWSESNPSERDIGMGRRGWVPPPPSLRKIFERKGIGPRYRDGLESRRAVGRSGFRSSTSIIVSGARKYANIGRARKVLGSGLFRLPDLSARGTGTEVAERRCRRHAASLRSRRRGSRRAASTRPRRCDEHRRDEMGRDTRTMKTDDLPTCQTSGSKVSSVRRSYRQERLAIAARRRGMEDPSEPRHRIGTWNAKAYADLRPASVTAAEMVSSSTPRRRRLSVSMLSCEPSRRARSLRRPWPI